MSTIRLIEFGDESSWTAAVVAEVTTLAGEGARVALAGGATPAPVYRALGRLGVSTVRWWLGDERLPPGTRNEFMIRRAFASEKFEACFEPWLLEGGADDIAADYERRLRAAVGTGPHTFDLALLGLGEDGHTASLFPGAPELSEENAWALATQGEHAGCRRLTLTLPVWNAARQVWFLVRGEAKARMVERLLAKDLSFPAACVRGPQRVVAWLREPGI